MPLHFTDAEYAARQAAATQALQAANLDAILLFAPESQYWISGSSRRAASALKAKPPA